MPSSPKKENSKIEGRGEQVSALAPNRRARGSDPAAERRKGYAGAQKLINHSFYGRLVSFSTS